MQKEAKARIKINKLLEDSGWKFFDDEKGKANISLEPGVKVSKQKIDELGNFDEKIELLAGRNTLEFLVENRFGRKSTEIRNVVMR
mgnify:CR=1 FL=1